MDGNIPPFTSTLSLLALQNNHLKVLSDIHMTDNMSMTTILLHNNLLSCYLPMCGNATVTTSITAIGNRLRYPKGQFPAWVREYEHDPLLWVSGTDGMSLVQRITGAVGLFIFVVVSRLGRAQLLRAMSEWQIGPGPHLWLVKASSHLHASMMKDSSLAGVFIMLLLSWDLYVCPADTSNDERLLTEQHSHPDLGVLVLVQSLCPFFGCGTLNNGGREAEGREGEEVDAGYVEKTIAGVSPMVCIDAVSFNICYLLSGGQVHPRLSSGWKNSVVGPESLHWGHPWIGGQLHCSLSRQQMSWQKQVFTTVSSLLLSCVIPAAVIIYLDAGCLGRWVSLWKPCRSNSLLFQRRLTCTQENEQDCALGLEHWLYVPWDVDIMILRPSDICQPRYSLSSTSMSRCIHISLLRLQEIWLTKFITTGLVMPGGGRT